MLARSNITVYLADRSGFLGSATFNMHDVSGLVVLVVLVAKVLSIEGPRLFHTCGS